MILNLSFPPPLEKLWERLLMYKQEVFQADVEHWTSLIDIIDRWNQIAAGSYNQPLAACPVVN